MDLFSPLKALKDRGQTFIGDAIDTITPDKAKPKAREQSTTATPVMQSAAAMMGSLLGGAATRHQPRAGCTVTRQTTVH